MNTRIALLIPKKQTPPNLFLTKNRLLGAFAIKKRSKTDQYMTEGGSQPVALDGNAQSLAVSQ